MRKKKNALLSVAISLLIATNMNTAEMAPAEADKPDGPSPAIGTVLGKHTDTFKRFNEMVGQQKYDEAVTFLRVAANMKTIDILKTTMLLDDREKARDVFAKALGKYPVAGEERQDLYEYAIFLSKNQHFTESLAVLSSLYIADQSDKSVIYDYIVVLNWSGNNRAALDVYEKHKSADMPAYVVTSAAGAYYKLGDYKTAQTLFHAAGAAGNRKALIWEAQSFYRMGDAKSGDSIYAALLKENANDIETLRSRATMLMMDRNYRDALADFEKVIAATASTPNAAEVRKAVDYDMAIAYIRVDEETKAIEKLKPYIDNGTADVFMQSDYILALRLAREYKTAIAESLRLWPDHGQVPVFGLQAMADSYVRSGDVKRAIPIYEHILRRDANASAAKLGLAFARMMAGDIAGGAKVYDELLVSDKSVVNIALDDAYYFNEQGRYSAGKTLFGLVIDRYPDAVLYRQEFAASLIDNNMPRDAFKQYQSIAKVEGGETAGLAGMTVAAVQVGDYTQAKDKVSKLQDKYAENALTLEAVKSWENRRLGGMEMGFVFFRDYKGNDTQLWRIAGDQSIGGSFSVLVEATRDKLTDHSTTPHEKTTLNSQSVGLGFKGINSDFQAWYHSFKNNGTFSGYSLLTNFYPTDHFVIGLDITKKPLLDVQALNPSLAGYAEKRIMTTNYTLRTRIINGEKDRYDLSFTRSNYSDNNKVNSYFAGWTRTLKYNDRQEQYMFINWGYSTFSRQRPDLYESPPQRDSYMLGFSHKWKFPKHYWEATIAFGWGRDRPEPFDFSPFGRLEYGYNFSETRSLTAGIEYGGRTDRLNNSSSLHLGYRQYDLLYKFSW